MAAVTIAESLSQNTQTTDSAVNTERSGQSFVAALSGYLTQIVLYLGHTGADGLLYVEVHVDSEPDGKPNGAPIATGFVSTSAIGEVKSPVAIAFDGTLQLLASNSYTLSTYFTAGGPLSIGVNSPSAYASGTLIGSVNSGSTWTISSTLDMYFGVYGSDEPPVFGGGLSTDISLFESWGW